ncbi:hypothetical protein [Stutzerimonas stutzeri]|uniref:hypothetical protein n=1 Tax=Stutzerimonas stutzeri TaxID=316 RepID=UPI00147CF447|nr:hypothetical protein [Stutzerimonas stutzeri]
MLMTPRRGDYVRRADNHTITGIIIKVNRDGTMDVQGPFRPLINEKISDWQLARGEA